MTMTDPISDMLTRIRNANIALHPKVDIPGSRIKIEIAKVLQEEGFIRKYKFIEDNKQGILRIYMKYNDEKERVITDLKRISKPGRRVYRKAKEIDKVLGGIGIAIISTPIGIVTDKQARKYNVGGEILCHVW